MFKPEAVRAEFNLPEHVEPVNILLVGYGAGIPADPGRHELLRKPLRHEFDTGDVQILRFMNATGG